MRAATYRHAGERGGRYDIGGKQVLNDGRREAMSLPTNPSLRLSAPRFPAGGLTYAAAMSTDEEQRGEHRHRPLADVRAMRLAAMTDDERAEFDAAYQSERQRVERTAQS